MILWEAVFPFWDSLTDLQQTEILDSIVIRHYDEGERIKKRQGLYVVSEGGILVYVTHGSGRKRVLLTGKRLDVILLTKEFLNASDDIFLEVRANKDSEIYYIPSEELERIMEESKDVRRFIIDTLSKHLLALSTTLYDGLENIATQLAMFLLRATSENGGSTSIEISHEELAERLGTTREVITRNLRILKNIGLVETGRNRITNIDVEGINEFIEEQED